MKRAFALLLATLAAGAAYGQLKVQVNKIDIKGVGEPIGTVTITEGQGDGGEL